MNKTMQVWIIVFIVAVAGGVAISNGKFEEFTVLVLALIIGKLFDMENQFKK